VEFEGIGPARIEQLLESATRMTLDEKQAYLGNLGFRVARTSHYVMLTGLLRATDLDAAFAATCDLWWHQLTNEARAAVEESLETGRGPKRERQSRSLEPLFHWNGTTTVVGEAVLRWLRNRTGSSAGPESKRRAADENLEGKPTDIAARRIKEAAIDPRDVDRVLSEIHSISPGEFERLTANLALALGYADDPAKVKVVGQTADGGIDVIINDDLLGTSPKIFIQAKRWKGPVGIAEVQRFGGVLSSRQVPRGLLITPSSFTNDARRWAQHSPTVTLVDGGVLAAAIIRSGHSVDDLLI
jgi:restriction endonuclease